MLFDVGRGRLARALAPEADPADGPRRQPEVRVGPRAARTTSAPPSIAALPEARAARAAGVALSAILPAATTASTAACLLPLIAVVASLAVVGVDSEPVAGLPRCLVALGHAPLDVAGAQRVTSALSKREQETHSRSSSAATSRSSPDGVSPTNSATSAHCDSGQGSCPASSFAAATDAVPSAMGWSG